MALLKTLAPDEVRAALLDLAERQPQTRKALLMLLERRAEAAEEAEAIAALHAAADGGGEGVDKGGGGVEGGPDVAASDTALMAKVNGHLFCASVVAADNCAHCGEAFTSGEVDSGGESCECTACKVAVHRKCIPYTDMCLLEKERRKSRRVKAPSARPSVVDAAAAAQGRAAADADANASADADADADADEDEDAVGESESDSEDGGFDEVSENSSDGEANSSDEEGEDGGSAAAAATAAAAAEVGTPIKVSLDPKAVKAEAQPKKEEPAPAFSRHRRHGRTGAAEDWKKHTISFRVRGPRRWEGGGCVCVWAGRESERGSAVALPPFTGDTPPRRHDRNASPAATSWTTSTLRTPLAMSRASRTSLSRSRRTGCVGSQGRDTRVLFFFFFLSRLSPFSFSLRCGAFFFCCAAWAQGTPLVCHLCAPALSAPLLPCASAPSLRPPLFRPPSLCPRPSLIPLGWSL